MASKLWRRNLPDKKNQPPPDQDRTVVIVIDKDKKMHINNEDTDMDKLGPRLEQIFKTRAERVVFVKGDPDLEYQTVARAIDIAKGAQMDKVGLMTPKWSRETKQNSGFAARPCSNIKRLRSNVMKSTLLVAGNRIADSVRNGLRQTQVARRPQPRGAGLQRRALHRSRGLL